MVLHRFSTALKERTEELWWGGIGRAWVLGEAHTHKDIQDVWPQSLENNNSFHLHQNILITEIVPNTCYPGHHCIFVILRTKKLTHFRSQSVSLSVSGPLDYTTASVFNIFKIFKWHFIQHFGNKFMRNEKSLFLPSYSVLHRIQCLVLAVNIMRLIYWYW